MSNYVKNIEILRHRNPRLADRLEAFEPSQHLVPEPAKSGDSTLKIDGIYLHSRYDPAKEANEWAKSILGRDTEGSVPARPITVLGFGLGYHLRELAALGFKGVVIERDPGIVKLALECSDLRGVLEHFDLLVGVEPEKLHRAYDHLLAGITLPHPASLRVDPDYLGALNSYAETLKKTRKGGLKILVVNPIYGGSLPAAYHCTRALRQMGHKVVTYDSNLFAEGMKLTESLEYSESRRVFQGELTSFLSKGVELMVRETRPDMILALAQAPLIPSTLQKFDKMGIPSAFWFVEDYRVLTYWTEMAQNYSYFFGIQKDNFRRELQKIGVTNYSYLPTAAAPEVHRPLQLSETERNEFGSPLSFVGAGYFNRQVFFKGLLDYEFKIWGSDWPLMLPLAPHIQCNAARIDTETCVRIFNSSKINLNLHSSTHQEDVVADGDFVNPRTFEIACCGAFQLVDRRNLLAELFADGEMETFSDIAELREKIDYYLKNANDRMVYSEKARKRVLQEHTYRKRMEELVTIMVSSFPHLAEKHQRRLDQRSSVLDDLDSHEGLAELMERLQPGTWFTLEDIYRNISTSGAELSRAEKIFVALSHVETVREAPPQ